MITITFKNGAIVKYSNFMRIMPNGDAVYLGKTEDKSEKLSLMQQIDVTPDEDYYAEEDEEEMEKDKEELGLGVIKTKSKDGNKNLIPNLEEPEESFDEKKIDYRESLE